MDSGELGLNQKSDSAYFSPEFFRFLKQLRRNNNREWFTKNKPLYEKFLLEPSLRFIKDARTKLKTVSPYLVADPRPFGGSLFRIYRDIRFSKDKSPYKTNVAMQFWHKRGGKNAYGPGLYLHLSPGQSFGGGGIWHPDTKTLSKIRKAIVARPAEWKEVKQSGPRIEGASLKRPPIGFDANHPFIDDLKLKDYTAGVRFKDAQVTSPAFLQEYLASTEKLNPLNEFLAEALGLPW